jgi:cation diffusion facilitator CzcD-associated flavoprotein CzcO
VYPRELDVPGVENFKGDIFHSARWKSDADLHGKDVVVFGNGCTAAQIVPAIVHRTNSLTQMVRSKHWVFPPVDFTYPNWMKWMFKTFPFTLWLHRLSIFLVAENEFRLFPMTSSAARLRARRRVKVENYMRKTAPAKFHDMLVPDFDVGCKRRIFDCGYLQSMHAPNFDLTMEPAREILPHGVRTDKGEINADVIIMANGFRTNEFIDPMTITGIGGETLTEHWDRFGGPEAYNCSVLNKFPNFFMILGPNAATGHTSAIMASENTINYAMRVLKPVVDGDAEYVEIRADAEAQYAFSLQDALKQTVWSSGCDSWYVKRNKEAGIEWNAMSYPYSQGHFWYRSLFPRWADWVVKVSPPCGNHALFLLLPLLTSLKARGTAVYRTRNSPTVSVLVILMAALLFYSKL